MTASDGPLPDGAPLAEGPRMGPSAGGAPRQLVVLCHGVGADGHDLIDLAPYLATVAPHAAFFAPDAPEPFDQAPYGRQWFPLGDLSPGVLAAGIRGGQMALDRAIDAECARLGVAAEDVVLIGFSQGAMTALFTGLRRAAAPRGIVSCAGALVDPAALPAELANRAPVLLTHGDADEIVPVGLTHRAAEALAALGVPAEVHIAPRLGHALDDATLAVVSLFVQRCLAG